MEIMVLRFSVQTLAVLRPSRASGGGARASGGGARTRLLARTHARSQAPGPAATQRYCFGSVSDSTACASGHGVYVLAGQDGNLRFSQGDRSIFSL